MESDTAMNTIEETIAGEFGKTIWSRFIKGVNEYRLIEPGDRIAVCISGGKDSMLMAQCMMRFQRYGKIPFETEFLIMDPGYAPENRRRIEENAALLDIPANKTAQETGCNKIALGHHFDDVIETILMGILYGSQVQTMMPKLHSENYSGMELIRPLYLVRERDIIAWRDFNRLSFLRCACRVTENKGEEGSKRQEIKDLLAQLRKGNPAVDMNIFRSVENVNLRTLISYHSGKEYHHFLDDYSEGWSIRGTRCQPTDRNDSPESGIPN